MDETGSPNDPWPKRKQMGSLVLHNAVIVGGDGGHSVVDATVVVQNGRIGAVGSREEALPVPDTGPVLDLTGKWLIPGLINCHDHVFNKAVRNVRAGLPLADSRQKIFNKPDLYLVLESAFNVLQELHQGVTTICDLGSRRGMAIQLRNAIVDGLVLGPRILAAGEAVTMTGGHFYMVSRQADGPDEVRKAVREQLHAGADCIKLMASGGLTSLPSENPGQEQFTVEELQAGVEEAHKAGRRVAAHAQATLAVRNAVEAGVDSIEHGFFLDDDTVRVMRKQGTHFVPTLNVPINVVRQMRVAGDLDLVDYMEREVLAAHRDAFLRAADAGLLIAAGTDSAGLMAEELETMVDFGLSPAEALATATRDAAVVCDINSDTGTIEPGKLADMVILNENPLHDIRAVRNVVGVIRGGVLFERDTQIPISTRNLPLSRGAVGHPTPSRLTVETGVG